MKNNLQRLLVLCAVLILIGQANADVRLPAVIGNHMVLQQNMPLKIWGWADPDEAVTVQILSNKVKTKADKNGKWLVTLPEMSAGGPHSMTVSGKNTVAIENILVGEVWVCSGQSNMEWTVRSVDHNVEETFAANYPQIRLFQVPKRASAAPMDDVEASWQACDPASALNFSAVAYFYGRMLHQELGVPVGLIHTSWGGTRIEPWTPMAGFEGVTELKDIIAEVQEAPAKYREALGKSLNEMEAWLAQAKQAYDKGEGLPEMPTPAQNPLADRQKPMSLYNGQVYGLVPFGIRGAIWYQGESNRAEGVHYFYKMKALIEGWRKVWAQGDFPFYFVQLAPYTYAFPESKDGADLLLAEVREGQRKALTIPNTGMAVTTDIGNLFDIHPRNKQEVGRRLALWALARTYGDQDVVYSGPLYRGMRIEGDKVVLQFDHAEGGLVSRYGEPLDWFEIAGADGKFVAARAMIKGSEVVVYSSQVAAPTAVRFGWHEQAMPNLMNQAGLPASPFSTETR